MGSGGSSSLDMVYSILAVSIAASVLFLVFSVEPVWADPYAYDGYGDSDGWIVTSDTRLTGDLFFDGDGITIGADGVVLDLNGHSIHGSGSGVGVRVLHRGDVTVRGGRGGLVEGFEFGVYIEGSSDVRVGSLKVRDCTYGVFIWSSVDVRVRWSLISDNGVGINSFNSIVYVIGNGIRVNNLYGVYLDSSTSTVRGNIISKNGMGVFTYSSTSVSIHSNTIKENDIGLNIVDSKVTIKGNLITANGEFGVYLHNTDGRISRNIIKRNLRYGIYILSSDVTLKENVITQNDVGVAIYSSNPTLIRNKITNNTSFGVYCSQDSNPTMRGNKIRNNGTDYYKEN